MRKPTLNIIVLNILLILGVTAVSTLLFLMAIRDETVRRAQMEQEQGIQTFWKLLRAKGTDFRIVDGKLMAGDYVINGNSELPDAVQSIFGGTATVFMGDTRVSTNVLKEDGTRAVGTKLVGPAYNAIFKEQRPYRGEAIIFGIPFFTAYDPILNSRGEVIGVLFVGAQKTEFFSRFEQYKANVIAGSIIIAVLFTVLAVIMLKERNLRIEATQESENRYRTLFESSAEAIFLFDDIIFDCNEQACRLFGSIRHEIIGKSPAQLSPELQPDGSLSTDKARQLVDTTMAGETSTFPWQHQRQDGSIIDTEVSLNPVTINGKRVLQASVRDVTERKRGETLIRKIASIMAEPSSEGFFSSLVLQLSRLLEMDYAFISELSGDRKSARTIAGCAHGRPIDNIEYLLEGTPCANVVDGKFCHYPDKVAEMFPDDHLLAEMGVRGYIGIPLRSSAGHPLGLVAMLHEKALDDHSRYEPLFQLFAIRIAGELERRKAERVLEQTNLRTRLILDAAGEGIYGVDREGKITFVNPSAAAMLGYTVEELLGLPSHETFHYQKPDGSSYPGDDCPITATIRHGVHQRIEDDIFFRRDGSAFAVEYFSSPVRENDSIVGSVVVFSNISDRKKAEKLLAGERFVLEQINSDAALDKVLEFLCRLMEEQAPELRCSILLVDADGRHLRHGAAPSLPEEYNRVIDGTRIGDGIGTCGTAAFTGKPVITGDIGTHPNWVKYRGLPLRHGLRACWSLPVKASNGRVIGTFAAYSTISREPSAGEMQLMERLCHMTSIAIERKRAAESLQMILLRQQAMLDNIPDLVWLKDDGSRFIAVNTAFAKACGTLPAELTGKTDLDVWPTDLATLYREDDARVMASGKQIRTEEPLVDATGKRGWIETIKTAVFNETGTVIGTTGIARDISERRETELKLRENEARLAKAQQIAHVGYWDWDILNNVTQFSDEMFRIFRALPGQVDMTYEAFLSVVHPDDRQPVIDAVNAALHEKAPYVTTYRIICANGEIRHLQAEAEVEFNQEGVPVRMQGVVRDITESFLAQEALRESEARFREIFEQNEDAIILLARETLDIIDANMAAETLIGRDRESLAWLGPWSFIVPEDYNSFIGAIPATGDAPPFHLERIGALRSDGTTLITSIWGKVIRLRDTEVLYCSIRDITRRISMEEEARITQSRLIHANKMASLGILVSGIAHEINNPNTFIQGNASLIESFWRDTVPILEHHRAEGGDFILGGLPFKEVERIFPRLLHGVREGSRRISAIVNNLKDFARQDTAKCFMPINVNRVVEDAKLILSYQIHRYTDNFRLDLPEGLPLALGKYQQIEQVIINLIINALQALPAKDAGVTVSTGADPDGSAITIAVRDEGEGMAREVLERITEPFFSTKIDQGGTGLGLSISAAIIREHNGSLRFESTPGQGTTVTVSLPIAYHAGVENNG